jgi:hypothetical protein
MLRLGRSFRVSEANTFLQFRRCRFLAAVATHNGRNPMDPTRTRGYVSVWYDEHANPVQLSVTAWTPDHEPQTIHVVSVGPFDDLAKLADDAVNLLTGQLTLW